MSLRKQRRGQALARKRHAAPPHPSSGGGVNPYSVDGDHVRDTVGAAAGLVSLASSGGGAPPPAAGGLLDRLCALLTPSTTCGGAFPRDAEMTSNAANSLLSLRADVPPGGGANLARSLAGTLGSLLGPPAPPDVALRSATALNQLAATDPPPAGAVGIGPGGEDARRGVDHEAPASWCSVIVQSSALSGLIRRLPADVAGAVGGGPDVEVAARCASVLGNLAGDSEAARVALSGGGDRDAVSRLVSSVRVGEAAGSADLSGNALWALANLCRDPGGPAERVASELGRDALARLLRGPSDGGGGDATAEYCWLLSYLTRHDGVASGLASDAQFVTSLVALLAQTAERCSAGLRGGGPAGLDPGCAVPCLRAVRNLAVSDGGRRVGALLRPDARPGAPLEGALAGLVSLGTVGAGGAASAVSVEAAACSGALLAASSPHPAALARRALVPALLAALTAELSPFELRREAVWALWTAADGDAADAGAADPAARREVLVSVAAPGPDGAPRDLARTAVGLLSNPDGSAAEPTVRLVDALLRGGPGGGYGGTTRRVLEEEGLADALLRVCEDDRDESEVAELAADLLDDYFEVDGEGEHGDEGGGVVGPSHSGGQFHFAAPAVDGVMSFDFSGPHSGSSAPSVLRAGGPSARGRGRGQPVVPSWMARHPG